MLRVRQEATPLALNREILRLRTDIDAVIHVHHDETIAFFAAGAKELRVLSLEFPFVMAMPPHLVPSHLDVENDVGPIADFITHTNSLVMENHGLTTLGRSLSEAYHRLNTLTSEIRRNILAPGSWNRWPPRHRLCSCWRTRTGPTT